jgi:hypothetical protein
MFKAIPDPEQTTTEADIELQLREALISTIAAIDPSLDTADVEVVDLAVRVDLAAQVDDIASNADFVGLDSTPWNYLDADDDADTGLF